MPCVVIIACIRPAVREEFERAAAVKFGPKLATALMARLQHWSYHRWPQRCMPGAMKRSGGYQPTVNF